MPRVGAAMGRADWKQSGARTIPKNTLGMQVRSHDDMEVWDVWVKGGDAMSNQGRCSSSESRERRSFGPFWISNCLETKSSIVADATLPRTSGSLRDHACAIRQFGRWVGQVPLLLPKGANLEMLANLGGLSEPLSGSCGPAGAYGRG